MAECQHTYRKVFHSSKNTARANPLSDTATVGRSSRPQGSGV